jgi:hypothetical protein
LLELRQIGLPTDNSTKSRELFVESIVERLLRFDSAWNALAVGKTISETMIYFVAEIEQDITNRDMGDFRLRVGQNSDSKSSVAEIWRDVFKGNKVEEFATKVKEFFDMPRHQNGRLSSMATNVLLKMQE